MLTSLTLTYFYTRSLLDRNRLGIERFCKWKKHWIIHADLPLKPRGTPAMDNCQILGHFQSGKCSKLFYHWRDFATCEWLERCFLYFSFLLQMMGIWCCFNCGDIGCRRLNKVLTINNAKGVVREITVTPHMTTKINVWPKPATCSFPIQRLESLDGNCYH